MDKTLILVPVLTLAGMAASGAAILAQYAFTNSLDTASSEDSLITASVFSPSGGITGGSSATSTQFNGFSTGATANGTGSSSQPIRYVRANSDSADINAAVTNGDYFSFVLTPTTGYQISLQTITIDLSVNGTNTVSNTASFAFATSVGGLTTLVSPAVSVTSSNASALAYDRYTFTLSGAEFASLTTPTEIRLYVSNSTNDPSAVARFDNVIINGAVTAIPEPSIACLALLGGAAAFRRRRA